MSLISAIATAGGGEALLTQMSMTGDPFSLYIHIPFCRRKCGYCHFYVLSDAPEKRERLAKALLLEWQRLVPFCADKKLVSLYFGGGTPALLGAPLISEIVETITAPLHIDAECEITVETNPEEITPCFVKGVIAGGVNRMSVGIQTHDDRLLHQLGRRHNGTTAWNSIEIAAAHGLTNLSGDLMYDLPNQNLTLWRETLSRITALPLQHLSLYNLTIEPESSFYRRRHELVQQQPPDEESAAMFLEAHHLLTEAGFEHYEISAFAKNGLQSRHNVGYWTNRPFFGLGPSAFSYWEGKRFRNAPDFQRYCNAMETETSAIDFSEELPPSDQLRERLMVNLRLLKGVDLQQFPLLDEPLENTIGALVEEGFLQHQNSLLSLTQRGLLFYDSVAAALL